MRGGVHAQGSLSLCSVGRGGRQRGHASDRRLHHLGLWARGRLQVWFGLLRLPQIIRAVRVVTALALQTPPSLKEVAHLGFVDPIGDSELHLSVREDAIVAFCAAPFCESFAQLRLLQVRRLPELRAGVRIAAGAACALPPLEEVAHLRFQEPGGHRVLVGGLHLRGLLDLAGLPASRSALVGRDLAWVHRAIVGRHIHAPGSRTFGFHQLSMADMAAG
mmetsp:Transcript_115141/g.273724  ORF Transcript_115141/g.273724 Transcript_115141/m.273724 type:complete len:219 (-) Transcript_115141:12-668(-)